MKCFSNLDAKVKILPSVIEKKCEMLKRSLLLKTFVVAGDNVDCWMEIQQGKGPWASPVNGIVPLGTTLTMVVGIDDKEGKKRETSVEILI